MCGGREMERTTVFKGESWGNGLGYPNVERNVLLDDENEK